MLTPRTARGSAAHCRGMARGTTRAAALLAVALLLAAAAAPAAHAWGSASSSSASSSASTSSSSSAVGGARRLLQPMLGAPVPHLNQIPFDAYDRSPQTGWARAKGLKPGGEPAPVQGLVNPDVPAAFNLTATMADLVLPFGYPMETYPVETADGFVLRVYRIPHGRKNSTQRGPKPVVILDHGVTLSSASYAVLDPESSMAFYLADAGFDVWLSNTRGNTFSRGHRYYKSTERSYWDNSMDELALIDRPTTIDFVLEKTGQKSVASVGHSQGCSLSLMLLAAKPEYADKIWLLLLMGPVVHVEYINAPFLKQMARTDASEIMLAGMGSGQFLPNIATAPLVSSCRFPTNTQFCFDAINFMFYGPSKAVSADDYMRIAPTWPSTVATRNLVHWSQMYHTKNGIYMYNADDNCTLAYHLSGPFRETCNQAMYGTTTPYQYDLTRISPKLKAAVMAGTEDKMSVEADVAALRRTWQVDEVFYKNYAQTAHMDFVWARRPIMKPDVLALMRAHAPPAV